MGDPVTIVGLHGFANSPSLFKPVFESLQAIDPSLQFLAPDLYLDSHFQPAADFDGWIEQLAMYLRNAARSPIVLMGYSMGGRLALHALFKRPELFVGGILLSASPGVMGVESRYSRKLWDEEWASRFRSWEWTQIQSAWADQPVFHGTKSVSLREDVSKDLLADSLVRWSQSQHLFEPAELAQLKVPTLWISGRKDPKYVKLHADLKALNSDVHIEVCESSGHRLLEDAPEYIVNQTLRFLKEKT